MLSKVPPHSREAENGLLGAIFIHPENFHEIASVISPDDFYSPVNATIYKAILELYTKDSAIDLLTVREVLDNKKELEKIGGNMGLVAVTNGDFFSRNASEYAKIIKDKSLLRKLVNAGNEIAEYGFDEATEAEELLEKAEQKLFSVSQIRNQNNLTALSDII